MNSRVNQTSGPRLCRLAAALAVAFAAAGGGAHAATQLVSNCNNAGGGSLRAAIAAAMSGDTVDATGLTCSTISLSTGALPVTVKSLTVMGAGPRRLTVTNGAKYGRVFRHEGNGTLTLQGMTITSGVIAPTGTESGTQGGCIYSNGSVTLGNYFDPTDAAAGVVVSDCTAITTEGETAAGGGAIFASAGVALIHSVVSHGRALAQGTAFRAYGGCVLQENGPFTMKYSEVSGCSAKGSDSVGGGIHSSVATAVTVSHSTIAGNTADFAAGGAVLRVINGSVIKIDNTTVSGNTAAELGGIGLTVDYGIQHGVIRLSSSTITENRGTTTDPQFATGVDLEGAVELQSTIISRNFNGTNELDVSFASPASSTGANNLLGVAVGNTFPPGIGHITSTDPKLGPLVNRGGFTRVHLPLANSPAINAGNNSVNATTDQRGPGFPRVVGSAADIGAAEFDSDRIFNNGFD